MKNIEHNPHAVKYREVKKVLTLGKNLLKAGYIGRKTLQKLENFKKRNLIQYHKT